MNDRDLYLSHDWPSHVPRSVFIVLFKTYTKVTVAARQNRHKALENSIFNPLGGGVYK